MNWLFTRRMKGSNKLPIWKLLHDLFLFSPLPFFTSSASSSPVHRTKNKKTEARGKFSSTQFNIKAVERVVLSTFQFRIFFCLHTLWIQGGTRVFQLLWLGERWLDRNGTFCAARKGLRKASRFDFATGPLDTIFKTAKVELKTYRFLQKSAILDSIFLIFGSSVPFIAS